MADDQGTYEGMDFDSLPQQAAPSGAPSSYEGADFDSIPKYEGMDFDELARQSQAQPAPEGPVASTIRHGASSVLPGVAGIVGWGGGSEAGAALGSLAGPAGTAVGSVVGGAAGALVNAYLAQRAQKKAKEALGLDDEAQLAADAKAHPIASDIGDIGGSMVGMSPSAGASVITRLAAGAAGAGVAGGQQIASGNYDPASIALNAAAFAAAPGLNKLGAAAEGIGHTSVSRFIPGRPDLNHPVDASANQGTNVQNNEQQDPKVEAKSGVLKTPANPQSAVTRSATLYGKVKNFLTGGPKDTLSTGDVPPDVASALAGDNEPGVEPTAAGNPLVRSAPAVPRPGPENPGENIPIDSGVQQGAADQTRIQPPATPPADLSGMQQPPVTAAVTRRPKAAPDNTLTLSQDQPTTYKSASEQARYRDALADPEAMRQFAADEGLTVDEAREIAQANYEAPGPTAAKDAIAKSKAKTAAVAAAAQDADTAPTEAQKAAGNYKMGHTTFAGKQVSIESPVGSTRTSKPGAPEPWEVQMPYHYGYLRGTRAADSTKAKPQGIDIAFDPEGGGQSYVVDQKDADTGKFDEHKIFADTTTPDRVRELYNAGFSDGRGPERLGAITKASEDDIKAWLAKPAKKTKPYSKTFEEGVQRPVAPQEDNETLTDQSAPSDANVTKTSQSIPSETTSAEAEVPPEVLERLRALEALDAEPETPVEKPPIVDKVIKQMRDAGYEKAARVFERLPLEEQIAKAPTVYRIATTGEAPVKPLEVARVPGNREALQVKMGDKVVEAATKKEAAEKQAAFNGLKAAFDKHVPPEGAETADETRARAAAYYKDAAQHMPKLRVQEKPPEYALARHARSLVEKKIGPARFVAEEALLRDPDKAKGPQIAKQTRRIEADVDKRRGPTAEQAMENHVAPDLEETPDSAEVKNVTSAADLPEAKPDYDMSKPEDKEKIADALLAAGEKTTQLGHNGGPPMKEETVSERIARQKAARLAAKGIIDETKPKNQYGKAIEKAHAKDAAKEAAEAEAARRANIDKAAKKPGVVKDLFDYFTGPTPKGLGADASPSSYWQKIVPAFSFARDAEPGAETVGRYVNKDLAQVGRDSTSTKYDIMDWANQLPKPLEDLKARERAYRAYERNDLASLPPQEEAAFNAHTLPMFESNTALYDAIQEKFPGVLAEKVKTPTHVMRVTKGSTADYNILKEDDDPVAGGKLDLSAINSRAQSTGLDRRFMALQSDADGKRFVISVNKDGYTVFVDGKGTRIRDPNFEFKEGEHYKVGNDSYTMTQALTDEIEDNARFENGKRVRYYHDPILSAGIAHQELRDLWDGLNAMEKAKKQLQDMGLMVAKGYGAEKGWVTTKLPNFEGYRMDPHIADVLDNFAKPGLNDSALDVVRRVNTALAKTMFWNPIPHMFNELTHAFVGRGYRWLLPQRYARLANTSAKAQASVMTQDAFQRQLADNGASLIYRPLGMHNFLEKFATTLGHEFESNPAKWDPIAKKFGVGPSDLVKAIYGNASKILWAAHDVAITQGVMERMEEGMTMRDAIVDLERHMPNYEIPMKVMGSRALAKLMREKSVFMFGNYHYGVWNGYANIFKDVVHGNGRDKAEAAGNIVALAALGGIYYEMDKLARYLTGNPDASQQRRGPYAVPSHILGALKGQEDLTSFARSTYTTAPLTTAVFQLLTGGKDYNGKAIVDPGTLSHAAKGSPKAAAKAVGQAGDWVARSAISPYSTISNAWHKKEGPGAALQDQLTDEKRPSDAARKWLHQLPKRNAQSERTRERHPAGLIEAVINKLVGR